MGVTPFAFEEAQRSCRNSSPKQIERKTPFPTWQCGLRIIRRE
jgi:hypothetical protein